MRSRYLALLLGKLCILLLLPTVISWGSMSPRLRAQESEQAEAERSGVPFRRILVPVEDLEQVDLSEFVPISVSEWDGYLQASGMLNSDSGGVDSPQESRLLSSYYAARLVGADLVSDRSKLVLSKPKRSGDRVTLSPWSLAISNKQTLTNIGQPAFDLLGKASSTVPTWTFDSLGLPRVPAHRSAKTWVGGFEPDRAGTVHWFGWSVRSTLGSQPNRLRFDLELPRSADSCLLLQLPPRAVVQESRTACRRIEEGSNLKFRFVGWPDIETDLALRQPAGRTADSIWLIELSGSQDASFQVVLGAGDREPDSLSKDPVSKYSRLVRTQKLEHKIEQNEIRTSLDLEIMHSEDDSLFRLEIPQASKLRALRVNLEEKLDWQVVDNWVQWRIPKSALSPLVVSKNIRSVGQISTVSAELITPIEFQPDETLLLPRLVLDRSYVMAGTTVVNATDAWRVGSALFESSKLIESKSTLQDRSKAEPIEFAWQAFPPVASIQIRPIQTERRCEALSQLENEKDGIRFTSRLRFLFRDQDSNRTTIQLGAGWQVRTIRSLEPSDPVDWIPQSDILPSSTDANPTVGSDGIPAEEVDGKKVGQRIDLIWNSIALSRRAEIEIVCFRTYVKGEPNEDQLGFVRYPASVVLTLPTWVIENNTAIIPSAAFPLLTPSLSVEAAVAAGQLNDREKQLLVFQEPAVTLLPKNQALLASELTLPALVFQEKEIQKTIDVFTRVEAASHDSLVIEHDFDVGNILASRTHLEIELDDLKAKWAFLDGDRWVLFSPTALSKSQLSPKPIWNLDLGERGNTCKLRATSVIADMPLGSVSVPLPKVKNGQVQSHAIGTLPSRQFSMETDEGEWDFNELGERVLKIDPAIETRTLSVRRTQEHNLEGLGMECQVDVAVDAYGSQRASCLLRLKRGGFHFPLVLELENSWSPLGMELPNELDQDAVRYRLDGQRLILEVATQEDRDLNSGGADHLSAIQEIRVQLLGPRLKTKPAWFRDSDTFDFHWPSLAMEKYGQHDPANFITRWRLWLPKEVVLKQPNMIGAIQSNLWPFWAIAEDLGSSLLGSSLGHGLGNVEKTTNSISPFAAGFDRLFQMEGIGGGQWRMVQERNASAVESTKGQSIVGTGGYQLRRSGRDLSSGLLVFAAFLLIAPFLVVNRPKTTTLMVLALIAISHWDHSRWSFQAMLGLMGLTIGFVMLVIHRCMFGFLPKESAKSLSHSRPWMPWNDREESGEPKPGFIQHGSSVGNIAKRTSLIVFAFLPAMFLLLLLSQVCGRLHAQDVEGAQPVSVVDVVVPINEAGEISGANVFIPRSIAQQIQESSEKIADFDVGTRILSARHTLSLGMRGRADLLTMTYEFWVGQDLSPVRLPINSDQVQSLRFVLDNVDLLQGPRLRRSGNEWDWIPEKAGKRVLRISAQPIMKAGPLDSGRDARGILANELVQQLDIAILPVANASVEIDLDPLLNVDIVSRGQVNNPAAGKYIALLGAVDRLQCRFFAISSNGSVGFSSSNPMALEGPTMNTELLLMNDALQAKTIIEFPKGILFPREIAIEADLPWIPIGTQWGDAKWVDVRSGSTLARRRYILEWNTDPNLPVTIATPAEGREISVVWIPQTNTQNLNVLFAECLDRRTKLGTLRYSRNDGAKWSIEGINTWVPAISSKERLEWPELKNMPIATTLRIPITGGFGVLKPRTGPDRQQARITTKWILERESERISSRVELLGGGSSSDMITVELPLGFKAIDVANRTGSVRFLQWETKGRIRLQLLAERRSLELNELLIQARRDSQSYDNPGFNEWTKSGEVPWLKLPARIALEQSVDLAMSEPLRLQLDESADPISGKGIGQSVAVLVQNGSDLNSLSTSNRRYQASLKPEFQQVSGRQEGSLAVPQQPANNTLDTAIANSNENQPDGVRPNSGISIRQCIHSFVANNTSVKSPLAQTQSLVMESRYWIASSPSRNRPNKPLRWNLSHDGGGNYECEVLSIQMDGNPIEFKQLRTNVECSLPLGKLATEVVLLTQFKIIAGSNLDSKLPRFAPVPVPDLQDYSPDSTFFFEDGFGFTFGVLGEPQLPNDESECAGVLAETWCDLFSTSMELASDFTAPLGSHWERWQRYWNVAAFERLQTWAFTKDCDPDAFDAAVKKWHFAKDASESRLSQSAKELLQSKLSHAVVDFATREMVADTGKSWNSQESKTDTSDAEGLQREAFSVLGSLLLLVCSMLLWDITKKPAGYRPWWLMLFAGLLVWAVFGTLIPALLLSFVAAAVAIDSYLLVTARLRQSEIRGLR